jgi:hypothetical protein
MSDKVPCTKCGAMILPMTAARTGGLCMPCKSGIRDSIEASKRFYEEQKKYDPWRELWHSLVMRVHKTDAGFDGLTADEKIYYAVSILDGEVHNGGFDQFFSNSSGALFREVASGLEILGAHQALDLLMRAKQVVFRDAHPPIDRKERWTAMRFSDSEARTKALDEFDRAFWKEAKLPERLRRFAEEKSIITPFLR